MANRLVVIDEAEIPHVTRLLRVVYGRSFQRIYSGLCMNCQKIFWTHGVGRSCCSRRCAGLTFKPERRGQWTESEGYLVRARPGACQERQHRTLMAEWIGRPLESFEIPHHVNHDGTDNRPLNLVLVTNAENVRLNGAVWKYIRANVPLETLREWTESALTDIRSRK